jgi:hypothetical protein
MLKLMKCEIKTLFDVQSQNRIERGDHPRPRLPRTRHESDGHLALQIQQARFALTHLLIQYIYKNI